MNILVFCRQVRVEHDGQGVAALAWSFISRLVCQNIHPWKDFQTSLCRFGCGLLSHQALDNPGLQTLSVSFYLDLCQEYDFMYISLYLLVQIIQESP